MKRLLFFALFLVLMQQTKAQYVDRSFFKAGFHAATTLSDASDFANLGLGIDLYQHWGVSKALDVGFATGLNYYFGLDSTEDVGPVEVSIRGEDTIFLPLAGLFRLYPTKSINIGADIGYALGLNEFTEGGFYYRPTLSFDLSPTSALNFTYLGIENDVLSWSAVTGGVLIRF